MSITRLVFKKAEPSGHEQLSLFNNEGSAAPAPAPARRRRSAAPAQQAAAPVAPAPVAPAPVAPGQMEAGKGTIIPDIAHLKAFAQATGSFDNEKHDTLFDWHHDHTLGRTAAGDPFSIFTADYNDQHVKKLLAQPESEREFTLLPVSHGIPRDYQDRLSQDSSEMQQNSTAFNAAFKPPNPQFIESVRSNDSELKGEDGLHLYTTTMANRPSPLTAQGHATTLDWLRDLHEQKEKFLKQKTVTSPNNTGDMVVDRSPDEVKRHKGFIFLCHEKLGGTSGAFCHRRSLANSLQDELRIKEQASGVAPYVDGSESKLMGYLRHIVDVTDAAKPVVSLSQWYKDQYSRYSAQNANPLSFNDWRRTLVPIDFSNTPNISISSLATIPTQERLASQVVPSSGWSLGADLRSSTFPNFSFGVISASEKVPGVHTAFQASSLFGEAADVLLHPASVDGTFEKDMLTDEFKQRYPKFFAAYKKVCSAKPSLGDTFWFQPKNENGEAYGPAIMTLFVRQSKQDPIQPDALDKSLKFARSWIDKRFPYDATRGALVISPTIGSSTTDTVNALKSAFSGTNPSNHAIMVSSQPTDKSEILRRGSLESGVPIAFFEPSLLYPEKEYHPNDSDAIFFGSEVGGASSEPWVRQFGNFSMQYGFDSPVTGDVSQQASRIPSSEYLYQLLKLSNTNWPGTSPSIMRKKKSNVAENVNETTGNLTDESFHKNGEKDGYDIIVNTCNTQLNSRGKPVMGAGLAEAFSTHFAGTDYQEQVAAYLANLPAGRAAGTAFICQPMFQGNPIGPRVASLFVKDDFRDQSDRNHTNNSITSLFSQLKKEGQSRATQKKPALRIAMPHVSAGLGERGNSSKTSVQKTGGWIATRKHIVNTFKNSQGIITDIVGSNAGSFVVPLLDSSQLQEYANTINSPMDMKSFIRQLPIREDWDQVRDSAMKFSLIAKIFGNRDFAQALLAQKGKTLIEVSHPADPETPFGERSSITSVSSLFEHPDVKSPTFDTMLKTKTGKGLLDDFRAATEANGPQSYIRDLKNIGYTRAQIAAMSVLIRSELIKEMGSLNPLWSKAELGDDGSTVIMPQSAFDSLQNDEPGLQRVMVGNHGIYLEMSDVFVNVPEIDKRKQSRFYDTYRRDSIKYYRQKARVNYAEYEPLKFYSAIENYATPKPQRAGLNEVTSPITDATLPDVYWGTTLDETNMFRGENKLGHMLMEIRDDIITGKIDVSSPYPIPQDLSGSDLFGHYIAPINPAGYSISDILPVMTRSNARVSSLTAPELTQGSAVKPVLSGIVPRNALVGNLDAVTDDEDEDDDEGIDSINLDIYDSVDSEIEKLSKDSANPLGTFVRACPKHNADPKKDEILSQNKKHAQAFKDAIDSMHLLLPGKSITIVDHISNKPGHFTMRQLRNQFFSAKKNISSGVFDENESAITKNLLNNTVITNGRLIASRALFAIQSFQRQYPGWLLDAEDAWQELLIWTHDQLAEKYKPELDIEPFLGYLLSPKSAILKDKMMTMAKFQSNAGFNEIENIEKVQLEDVPSSEADQVSKTAQKLISQGAEHVLSALKALAGEQSSDYPDPDQLRVDYGFSLKKVSDLGFILDCLSTTLPGEERRNRVREKAREIGISEETFKQRLDDAFLSAKETLQEMMNKKIKQGVDIDPKLIARMFEKPTFSAYLS